MSKLKSFKSIIKSIESLNDDEYFYTSQSGKSVFSAIAKHNKKLYVRTKKCFVLDPVTGKSLDTLTRVTRYK